MKDELSPGFIADLRRLSDKDLEIVRARLRDFIEASERYASDPTTRWPKTLRVRDVEGARGVMEVTFNFSGPDIRATFEWIHLQGELAVRWRRIGGHDVFDRP